MTPSTDEHASPRGALYVLGWMILIAWILESIDLVLPERSPIDQLLAILPRSATGLVGVVSSPFAHGGFVHLISNTVPWIILGVLTSLGERQRFARTTLILIILSGLGTWLIGRNSLHLGASGLIYGYFGYVLARAWYKRTALWIIAAVVTMILFGSMAAGVVPTRAAISWEGHLAGFAGGIYLARARKKEDLSP